MFDDITKGSAIFAVAFIIYASVASYAAFRVSDAGRMETCLANGYEWRDGDCVRQQGAPR